MGIAESMNDNQFNNKILSSSMYWFKKELQRIRYVLNSYLRIRLWKIQKFTLHILSDIDAWNRLSNAEQDFATAYSDLNERHFKNCFLKDLPNKYQTMTEAEMFVKPDLNKFVVIKSNVNDDNIMIGWKTTRQSPARQYICITIQEFQKSRCLCRC